MDKKKKIIFGAIATIIIVGVVVVVIKSTGNKSVVNNTPSDENVTTVQTQNDSAEDATVSGDETKKEDNKDDSKDDKKADKNSEDGETNYWDNVEVYEETKASEVKTDKDGETITESYPGEMMDGHLL